MLPEEHQLIYKGTTATAQVPVELKPNRSVISQRCFKPRSPSCSLDYSLSLSSVWRSDNDAWEGIEQKRAHLRSRTACPVGGPSISPEAGSSLHTSAIVSRSTSNGGAKKGDISDGKEALSRILRIKAAMCEVDEENGARFGLKRPCPTVKHLSTSGVTEPSENACRYEFLRWLEGRPDESARRDLKAQRL